MGRKPRLSRRKKANHGEGPVPSYLRRKTVFSYADFLSPPLSSASPETMFNG